MAVADFSNDDGSPDHSIRNAADPQALLDAIQAGRLLVAVVAQADEIDAHGADKSSHMSVVSMVSADGRRGLLAFSGLDSLQVWDATARPVPVSGSTAAQAALDDGCEAMVIDVAGPRRQVVVESDLLALAGVDPLAHAQLLTQQAMDQVFGTAHVVVHRVADRLRVVVQTADPQTADPEALYAALEANPRLLALVPQGVEIVVGGSRD